MAKITTITNPLTGQPAQVDQLEHTAQQIDDAIARALPGGDIDIALQKKAPGGYGLGGNAAAPTTNDADSCTLTGWYAISSMSNCPFTYGLLRVEKWYDECIFQTAYEMSSGVVVQRRYQNSEWTPWEYVNPPMQFGVEYRTTELSMGKPVYVKLVNFGAIPTSGTTKSVEHGISNVQFVIHVFGTTSVGFSIPYGSNADRIYIGANTTHISIENAVSSFDASAYSAYVIIKYTKTTD